MPRLHVRIQARRDEYEIRIGRGILSESGKVARSCLGNQTRRIALISNKKVFSLYGFTVIKSLQVSDFSVRHWLIGDGERHKTVRTAEKALRFLNDNQIERSDSVISLGGGVVGDVAGFAAAIHMRGIPFIQIPTTLLAQIDSSVGGKTGVNLSTGKNLVGSFHQPSAVVIDIETLATLPSRELVAGWCETIKQGAVGSLKLFTQTTDFLRLLSSKGGVLRSPQLEKLIASHCVFKASIVAADEREDPHRRDRHSRRILNFGHTVAHALEAVTGYRRFRHGEAVGHGMLVAAELSKNLGLLDQSELELLNEGVGLCGPLPSANGLDESALISAIGRDKKRARGQVNWVLLERIGRPRIVEQREISAGLLRRSLQNALRK